MILAGKHVSAHIQYASPPRAFLGPTICIFRSLVQRCSFATCWKKPSRWFAFRDVGRGSVSAVLADIGHVDVKEKKREKVGVSLLLLEHYYILYRF